MRDADEPRLTEADKQAIEAIRRQLDRDFGPWGDGEPGGGRRDGIGGPIASRPKRRATGLVVAFAVGAVALTSAGALALVARSAPRATVPASPPAAAVAARPPMAVAPQVTATPVEDAQRAAVPTPQVPPTSRATDTPPGPSAVADDAAGVRVAHAPPARRSRAPRSHSAPRAAAPAPPPVRAFQAP